MCKTQCLIVILAMSIGLANSWDIAITTGDQLEFYSNNTKTSEGVKFRDLTALAYDAVHNMLLFVDKQNDNASIFSYHLATKKYQPLVRRRSYENIQGVAFDPVKDLLFWTDTIEKSIFYISLKPGTKNDVYGNLLIKTENTLPRAIAVDSCRGYIYWTNINVTRPTIERARLDGTERKVIIETDIHAPISIAVDQRTKRLYWADDKEGIHYSIESSDLEGKDRKTLYAGTNHQPNALTVSKDGVFWVDWGYKSVWQLPKKPRGDVEPYEVISFHNKAPFGVVANYPIADQTAGVEECQSLLKLSRNSSAINNFFSIPNDVGLFCLHGVKVDGKLECNCTPGFTGERCQTSKCYNFCINGVCSMTKAGQPQCSCPEGYSGSRCERALCSNYCFNNGVCSTNKDNIPECQCSNDYEGERCEILRASKNVPIISTSDSCNCTNENVTKSNVVPQYNGQFVETSCGEGWDPIRDPIIMVLGTLTGILCVGCAVLFTKMLQLKKRPRINWKSLFGIRKRIIVNKNVTPLTARPDQCEITIENCCNMNICETPCFEPRSTIRPALLNSKPGKEEKKNLISNMEHPDDLY